MICDGAKPGCACKLATASSAAVQNAILAKRGCIVPGLNGIVGRFVDESVSACGFVVFEGMSVSAAVQNAILAKRGCIVPGLNGIVGRFVDESVSACGFVVFEGMSVSDIVILDVMNEMNK